MTEQLLLYNVLARNAHKLLVKDALTEQEYLIPDLALLAQEQGAKIQDMAALDKLIIAISSVQNEQEGYYALRGWDKKSQA